MKTKNLLIIAVMTMLSSNLFGQNFKANISGTAGLINTKLRIQCELPLGDKFSYGANLNYYFVNWTGPVIEPFLRLYLSNDDNESGFFFQGKIMYGNLSYTTISETNKTRFSTAGFGLGCGYKILAKKSFTVEPLIGYRLLSAPHKGENQTTLTGEQLGEDVAWYLTTGLPLDFQLKFGYQF